MKKFLFALIMLILVLFSTQAFGEEHQTLYYCPDGNYYTEPCKPYYFEPGVTIGSFWYLGYMYYYPVHPSCPNFYYPRAFHRWEYQRHFGPYSPGFRGGHGYGSRGWR